MRLTKYWRTKMKRNIFITRELEIKREGNVLKIDDKKVPLSVVDNLFIIGRAKITRSATNLLLKNSRAIFYLDHKYELVSMVTPPTFSSDYRLRLKQYENFESLELAKFIVQKKIKAIEKFTQRSLQRYIDKLETVESMNELLGVEGVASTYMFKKFKEMLAEEGIDVFKKREYRPTKDPVNGLLSFLYTLYYSFLFSVVISEGFDPYVGFLHKKRGKHSAFVSDMMEEARIELTQLAYEILIEIYPDGFEGNYVSQESRRLVLKKFDTFILNHENTLLKEIKEKLC